MRRLLCSALLVFAACNDDPLPLEELFDGNVIIGDARPIDARPRDATEDAEVGADLDPEDVPPPEAGDAGPDTGPDADAGPICGRIPAETVNATTAAARMDLDGMLIDLVGTATLTALSCTDRACPPEMPCCNTCTASISVEGLIDLTAGACVQRVGCQGDECSQVCAPPILDVPQTFRGVLHHQQPRPTLELERVLP